MNPDNKPTQPNANPNPNPGGTPPDSTSTQPWATQPSAPTAPSADVPVGSGVAPSTPEVSPNPAVPGAGADATPQPSNPQAYDTSGPKQRSAPMRLLLIVVVLAVVIAVGLLAYIYLAKK